MILKFPAPARVGLLTSLLLAFWLMTALDPAPSFAAPRKKTAQPAKAAKKITPSPDAPSWSLHKLGEGSPQVFIVGGIQGDEPGGYSAASLLTTHYTINAGAVWVVPNLGFASIVKNSRGVYGDMNRKFADLEKTDPDFATVRAIQDIIRTPGLHLVLNLHDGSGFYRPTRISDQQNPQRWGQCVIIDQSAMQHASGDLEMRGKAVLQEVNRSLIKPDHVYYLKNTLTDQGNPEMEKSLTWYAVRNKVPAFGVEASKTLSPELRAFYHLQIIEAFLKQSQIAFTRHFPLTPAGVDKALNTNISIAFADNRVVLPLDNIRPRLLGTIPLPKDAVRTHKAAKPVLAVTRNDSELALQDGSRVLSRFRPEWCDVDTSVSRLTVTVDGSPRDVAFGETVTVGTSFLVQPAKGVRINAIGVTKGADEANITLKLADFQERYSLDRKGRLFRVEAYVGKRFAGMFLVEFRGRG